LAFCVIATAELNAQSDTSRDAALKRVTRDIKYLASDELGGRQPGTPGMELTEKFIIEDYKKIGLKPFDDEGTYLQGFGVGRTRSLEKDSAAFVVSGPDDTAMKLELDVDYAPQVGRGDFDASGDIVFVGYGISAEEHNFDDYSNVDCTGKMVVILRMEPQQKDEGSVFEGTENSKHAFINRKVEMAQEAGAAGIIFVNDSETAPDAERDELAPYTQFGEQPIPFVNVKRSVIDQILRVSPVLKGDGTKFSSLADVEADIDRNLENVSCELKGWSGKFTANFSQQETLAKNIIGIIEGEGPHADETIVIGAHHDHLGMGAYGSRAGRREIHNGADDNATGTAAVMELARRFAARGEKPKRRLVFVCFSAEEMGLLGARHYVENPIYPLENTVAMINFDMIGWLREKKLTIFNWNSSPEFDAVLKTANENYEMDLQLPENGFAGSDHLPFYQRQVPVMFFHTGLTDTYHTPEDDFETIDCDGALTVIEYTEAVVDGIAKMDSKPTFAGRRGSRRGGGDAAPRSRIRLGAILDDEVENGVTVDTIQEGSIAEKAGLKAGDVITEFAGEAVTQRREIVLALRQNVGETVEIKILRDGEEQTVEVELKK
jgi:hypothetical protein